MDNRTDNDPKLAAFGYKQELRRGLSMFDLIVFGMLFMGPTSVITLYGITSEASQGHNFIAYAIAIFAMYFTAYSYGKMAEAFPMAGSTYSYTQRSISPKLGFVAGWTILLDYAFLPMLLMLTASLYANEMVPAIPYLAWVAIFVAIITVVNIIGINVARKVNFVFFWIVIAAVVALLIAAARYIIMGPDSFFSMHAIYNSSTFSFPALMAGSILAISCFLGFDGMTTMTEEVRIQDTNKIGKAIMIAVTLNGIIYLFVSYFGTYISPDFTAFELPETEYFRIAFTVGGLFIQTFVTLAVLFQTNLACLASQASASRILYGMGRDKLLPSKLFGYVHPKFKTPVLNILIMAAISFIGALILSMELLSEMITFGAFFGFICVNLSVIVHFYYKNKSKNLAHVIVPVIGIAICVFVFITGMSSLAKIIGGIWLAIGIIYLVVRSKTTPGFTDLLKLDAFQERSEE